MFGAIRLCYSDGNAGILQRRRVCGPGQRRQGFLLRLHGHGHRGGDRVWCVVNTEIFTSGAFDDGGIWKLPSNKQGWTSVYEQNS